MQLLIDENNIKNLTMTEIADQIGISREYLQAIKSGRKGQTLKNLEKLGKVLNCPPARLLPISWQDNPVMSVTIFHKTKSVLDTYLKHPEKFDELNSHDLATIITNYINSPTLNLSEDDLFKVLTLFSIKNL